MKPVCVRIAIEDRDRMFGSSAPFKVNSFWPVAHRNRRAGHQRKFQLARDLDHPASFQPTVGQMLVTENWNALVISAENVGNLQEQFVTRIEVLPFLIPRILPMLTNEEYTVDSKPVT